MSVNDLSALLWRERELLDLLTFKLEEEQLLLTAGKTRWLQHATREVEQSMKLLREAGLARTVAASAVALSWGIEEDATLRELASAAPQGPWGEILASHLRAMAAQTNRIKELRDANEQFLRAAMRSSQETSAAGQQPAGVTYDAHGVAGRLPGARLFDQKL